MKRELLAAWLIALMSTTVGCPVAVAQTVESIYKNGVDSLKKAAEPLACVSDRIPGTYQVRYSKMPMPSIPTMGVLTLKADGTYFYKPDFIDYPSWQGRVTLLETNPSGRYAVHYCFGVTARTMLKDVPKETKLANITFHTQALHSAPFTINNSEFPFDQGVTLVRIGN